MRAMIGMAAALVLAGCAAEQGVDLDRDGALMFQQNCAACHGLDGRGEGSFGRNLIEAPPDLSRIAARNGGVFPLDQVMSAIDGYHRDPSFSAAMPEFGAGDMGPMVTVPGPDGLGTPVPLRLLELGRYIETIQRP
ncbi:c-type cytochrome [Histidinibacterium lentulum]|uniref:Cytochrome c n=1 Tax=Histidinibacterium lentulum TaxID=2480588 RepID=A0A3N2QM77_9RHOB|nr:c-type cytochrome [Histidinibacterium lentulum]ROT96297.1 cytochrome c [Histidinibacterium lentulum]